MILPVFLFLSLMVSNRWHVGIVFLIFIFAIWIHKLVNNRIIILLLLITSVVQITWSFKSSLYDYNESYAPAKEVAELIKKYDYKKLKILAFISMLVLLILILNKIYFIIGNKNMVFSIGMNLIHFIRIVSMKKRILVLKMIL